MSTEPTKPTSAAPAAGNSPRPAGSYAGRPGAPAGGPGGFRGRPAGPGMGAGPMGRGGKPAPRRRVCRICLERTGGVDWKAVNFLRNFVTERGKILSARATGTCSRCQRQLTRAIKRARNMALVPTSPL